TAAARDAVGKVGPDLDRKAAYRDATLSFVLRTPAGCLTAGPIPKTGTMSNTRARRGRRLTPRPAVGRKYFGGAAAYTSAADQVKRCRRGTAGRRDAVAWPRC